MSDIFTNIDKDALNLAHAIALAETGSSGHPDYKNTSGDNGTSKGAYQWQPGNYEAAAKKYGLDPNDFSPTNQDKVAYAQIKELKDKGHTPAEIASLWNSGSKSNYNNHSGTTTINGQTIKYDTPAYVSRVRDNYRNLIAKNNAYIEPSDTPVDTVAPITASQTFKNIFGRKTKTGRIVGDVGGAIIQGGEGIVHGIADAGIGFGKTALKLSAQGIENTPIFGKSKLGKAEAGLIRNKLLPASDQVSEAIKQPYKEDLATIPGKIGTGVGTIVAYTAPSSEIAGVTNAATGAIKGTGFLPAAARVATGATTEGLSNAGLTYALTGGDKKQAKTAGIVAGVTKGVFSGVGELLKKAHVDENLMNKIYKTDKTEQTDQLFSTSPKDTIARQAIDRGITGNVKNQARQIITGLDAAETKIASEFEKAGNPTLKIKNPKRYINAIAKEAEQFRNAGADDAANEIEGYAHSINDTGEIKAIDALKLRRLIDKFTHFRKGQIPTTQLSAEQAGFREMGNELRSQINTIGETSQAMKDYQFYIAAKDKLVKYATSTKNKAALGLIDKAILGESALHNSILGAGLVGARKFIVGRPATSAQIINNLPKTSTAGAGIRSAVSKGVSSLGIQQK